MPIDRSKFKAAPISAMKKLDGELGQRKGYSNYQKVGYHTIDSGDNKFRIYPPHPEQKEPVFWFPKSVAFLSLETDLYDEKGEKTGQKEIKRRPVFTSDIHGPKELAGKDLIKMYIEYAKAQFTNIFETPDEIKNASDLLYNWKVGVAPKLSWIMYADKYDEKGQKTLAVLEVGNGVKKKINELASEMDTGDSPVAVDPFTDPEDGIAIIVSKNGEGLQTEYKVNLESKKLSKLNISFVPTPLTDSDLEKFIEFKSLESQYKDSFRRKDFELQKEGLMRFDTDNQFFFFENPDFIEIMEQFQDLIYQVIPDEKASNTENKEEAKAPEKQPAKASRTPSGVAKTIPQPEPEEEYSEEEEDEEETYSQPEKPVQSEISSNTNDRLAAIKARLAAANKK
jgi:hypothetical protein